MKGGSWHIVRDDKGRVIKKTAVDPNAKPAPAPPKTKKTEE